MKALLPLGTFKYAGCMTTTRTITISLSETAADETVDAEYYQIEYGWITFKTSDHKAVVSYPEARVTRIKSSAK